MTDKAFIRSIKEDLVLIHKNLEKIEEHDLEILLWGAIYRVDEQLSAEKAVAKLRNKTKSAFKQDMIEPRIYPSDYFQRAKYILSRLKFHYPNYKKTYEYIKTTRKTDRYLGIPSFEFWAIKRDLVFLTLAFKVEMKEFRQIFVEIYLNRLSLSEYAVKHFGDTGHAGKKRAENLDKRFCDALSAALELRDSAEVQNQIARIENHEFEMYKLMKELDSDKRDKP